MEQIRICDKRDTGLITELIHKTILTCYPEIYPPEVAAFFINYHSADQVSKRLTKGIMLVHESDGMFTGTGFLQDDEMGGCMFIRTINGKESEGDLPYD
ncbi:MAG: hypothetical protein JW801_15420 [Bacteroidales bacterium]|nr:hypothetical protein [Bacteroidales bacterium]